MRNGARGIREISSSDRRTGFPQKGIEHEAIACCDGTSRLHDMPNHDTSLARLTRPTASSVSREMGFGVYLRPATAAGLAWFAEPQRIIGEQSRDHGALQAEW